MLAFVVVGAEVDGFLVDVRHQLVREARHAHLGVSHGGGVVAVHGTEVALAVDQHVAQRERLRHADDGVVDRRVAMRMVLTDHVTDHAGRLLVRFVPGIAQFVHREQYAAMDRLQAVANIGERTPHDDAHRVVEIALAHLVFDVDADDFFGEFCHQSASWMSRENAPAARVFRARATPPTQPDNHITSGVEMTAKKHVNSMTYIDVLAVR